jgi:DNA-binding NtrC family response regulator
MTARILLVDDDRGLSEVVELLLTREGYAVACAGTVKAGLERIRRTRIDLVITDLRLPDGTGLDAIGAIRRLRPELPIIMITSFSSLESAIAALRAGAVDYIVKPFDNDEFLHGVARALNERRMTRENALLKRNVKSTYGARPLIGDSAGMRKSLELIRKTARSDASVLIRGESGTGKELAAAAIHYASARAEAPFATIHCGMLPREAQEAEIFGHDADGGTLYLDEITELAPAVQVKLLDVLEERTDEQAPGADVRYIGATQRDVAAAVERGQFRSDLYYRLGVITIEMPPLRERGDDRLLLARHFAEKCAHKLGKRAPRFDAEFSAFLEKYAWPGNVRELANMIERAVILAEGDILNGRDLAEVAPALPMVRAAVPLPGGARPLAIEEYIRAVVERFQDSYTETELARMLGIGRKALWVRRRQWGLKRTQNPNA